MGLVEMLLHTLKYGRVNPAVIGAFFLPAAVQFYAGGKLADIVKARRSAHIAEEFSFARKVVSKVSGPEKEPNKTTMLLIQALGPAIIGVIGTIFAALSSAFVTLRVAGLI